MAYSKALPLVSRDFLKADLPLMADFPVVYKENKISRLSMRRNDLMR